MHLRRRYLLLAVTFAAAAAPPAFGQAVPPTVGPAHGGKQSASVPELSGMWVHGSIPGFEPMPSGPTALINRSRRDGVGNILELVGDYTNPILKPWAAEVVKTFGRISASGVGFASPRNQCWPGGVPFVFTSGAIEILQQPDKVAILYNYDHQVRHVRMNDRHPANITPSWYGDSVGHYEGDTLVIDTLGVKIGPFAAVDWYGTPHTEALHVIERYRLVDEQAAKEGWERDGKENFRAGPRPSFTGKFLQLQFKVDDAGAFTTPWTATMTYGRVPTDWVEAVCAENTYWFPGQEAALPYADKPDF